MHTVKTLAAALWLLCGLAFLDMQAGNPTAASGVVGAGLCALACSALAIVERN